MKILIKLRDFLLDPKYRLYVLTRLGLTNHMSDEKYLKKKFKLLLGYDLNLENPQTFNEKLQWLKLYDRKPEYTTMVDKYAVKKYVADKIGEQYIIPTLGVWDSFENIDFDKLPNQFVLKCTHDSSSVLICEDKSKFDKQAAAVKFNSTLKRNFYWAGREWPYKNVPRKIIAEKYMGYNLNDYKLLCFKGKCKVIEVHTDRFKGNHGQIFLDDKWNLTNITQGKTADKFITKPKTLDLMLKYSAILSKDITHLRVDWYEVNDKLYFGELTFYDGAGFDPFDKYEYDEYLGSLIDLPEKRV